MKGELLYEGKAKRVYQAEDKPGQLVLAYKDDVTAFNGEKKDTLPGKARLNNAISSHVFQELHERGIRTHFIKKIVSNRTACPSIRHHSTGSCCPEHGCRKHG